MSGQLHKGALLIHKKRGIVCLVVDDGEQLTPYRKGVFYLSQVVWAHEASHYTAGEQIDISSNDIRYWEQL